MWTFLVFCSAFFIQTTDPSFVTLTQYGYDYVVIKISPHVNISTTDCSSVLNSIQRMMNETSQALCTATEQKAFFKNITIIVPISWLNYNQCDVSGHISWAKIRKSDIEIAQSHPVFGEQPYTLQYSHCGIQGLPISVSLEFISNTTNKKKGVQLVHEWLHYRYGVFDENGGPIGDQLFPPGFRIVGHESENGTALPNSCTNVPLNGEWIAGEWNSDADNNQQVKSSLMFSTQLNNIELPCKNDNHKMTAPNKHNFHCNGRSVSDVVFQHEDFKDNGQPKTCTSPTFNVVSNSFRGFYIILDISAGMGISNRLENAKRALIHFIISLPSELMIAIDTFSSDRWPLLSPTPMDSSTFENIKKLLNTLQVDNKTTEGLGTALNFGSDMYDDQYEIILITAASVPSTDFSQRVEMYRRRNIAAYIISMGFQTFATLVDIAYHGQHYFIPDKQTQDGDLTNAFTWLVDTFQTIYSESAVPRVKVREEEYVVSEIPTNDTFTVDVASGRIVFMLYHPNFETLYLFAMIKNPSNETCLAFLLDNIYIAKCDTKMKPGVWQYSLSEYSDKPRQIHLDIWIESSEPNLLTVKTWTNAIHHQAISWKENPVTIYAQIEQNRKPIRDLQVYAHIMGNGSNETIEWVSKIQLNEDPSQDITQGDGIYTGIWDSLPSFSSTFSYVVTVSNTQAGRVDGGLFQRHPTSGSFIPLQIPVTIQTGSQIYAYGPSIQVREPPTDIIDILPPPRIMDFQVRFYNADTSEVTLSWTAPIDTFEDESEQVTSFRITGQNGTSEPILLFQGDITSSSNQLLKVIQLPFTSRGSYYYFRIYAKDPRGNEGLPSNIAVLYIPNVDGNPDPLPSDLFWVIVGCGIGFLVLAVILIVVLCLWWKKHVKKARKTHAGSRWVKEGEKKVPHRKNISLQRDTPSPMNLSESLETEDVSDSEFDEDVDDLPNSSIEEIVERQVRVQNERIQRTRPYSERTPTGSSDRIVESSDHQTILNNSVNSIELHVKPEEIGKRHRLPPVPPPRRNPPPVPAASQSPQRNPVPLASSPAYLMAHLQSGNTSIAPQQTSRHPSADLYASVIL